MADLVYPHKHAAVFPSPIELYNVHHFSENLDQDLPVNIPAGFYKVGAENYYVIGVILLDRLYPFMAPRTDLNNHYGRVKIRINNDTANETVPISNQDSLNRRFFNEFERKNIRFAEIHE